MLDIRGNADAITSRYTQALRGLRDLTGFSPRQVLLAEAGPILKTWAGRTRQATPAKADQRARVKLVRRYKLTGSGSSGPVSINAGLRGEVGRIWFRHQGPNGRSYRMAGQLNGGGSSVRWNRYHFKDSDWQKTLQGGVDYADHIAAYLRSGRQSIGLARQSVVQIADSLGINLASVAGGGLSAAAAAKVRGAIASNGRAYQNGRGRAGGDDVRAFVELRDTYPLASALGMDRTLLGVLAGRAGLFERSYALGVFKSQQAVARSFPNIIRLSAA